MKLLVFLVLVLPGIGMCQSPNHKVVKHLWHEALLQEIKGDYLRAVDDLNKVIEQAYTLSHPISEWYVGTSYYIQARCYARLGQCDSVRASVERAFIHQFRNNGLFRFDTTIISVCGRNWYDSLEQTWMNIQEKEMLRWDPQPPVIILPHDWEKKGKLNLIVALQGGNGSYIRFSDFWSDLSDTLNAMIVVPPATVRLSNFTNSWSEVDSLNMDYFERLLTDIKKTDIIDANNVYLCGYSQGAELALQLASCSNLQIRGVIVFSGFYNSSPCTLQHHAPNNTRIYALSGVLEEKENLASIKHARDIFTSENIPFKLIVADGMLHEIPVDFSRHIFAAWEWIHH